jgi:PAS domain-containing protein
MLTMADQTTAAAAPPAPSSAAAANLTAFLPTIERLPQPALLSDPAGSVLAINRPGLELLEADSAETVLGRNLISFLLPEDRAQAAAHAVLVEKPISHPPRYQLLTLRAIAGPWKSPRFRW